MKMDQSLNDPFWIILQKYLSSHHGWRSMPDDEYFKTGYHVDRYYELEEDLIKFLKFIHLELYDTPEERMKVKSLYLADY